MGRRLAGVLFVGAALTVLAVALGTGQFAALFRALRPEPPPARRLPPAVRRLAPRATVPLPGRADRRFPPLLSADGRTLAASFTHLGKDDSPALPGGARRKWAEPHTQVYDLAAAPPKLLEEYPGGTHALSPSGRRLVLGDAVLDRPTGRTLLEPLGLGWRSAGLCHFLDDERVLTVAETEVEGGRRFPDQVSRVSIRDLAPGGATKSLDLPRGLSLCVQPACGGREVWVYGEAFLRGGVVERSDAATLAPAGSIRLQPPEGRGTLFALQRLNSADGRWVSASTGVGADCHAFYDAATGVAAGGLPEELDPSGLVLLPGTRCACPVSHLAAWRDLGDVTAVCFDWAGGREPLALAGPARLGFGVGLAASADGVVVAVQASDDGAVRIYDLPNP